MSVYFKAVESFPFEVLIPHIYHSLKVLLS